MQDQETATLATIFSEVLANLAFMFTDEDIADPTPGNVWLETTIGYSGTAVGTLVLRCTEDFSTLLAANLLGADPNDDDTKLIGNDAVKEFMNIVCGQYVTAAYGTEEVFNLTIPKIVELSETPVLAACEETTAPLQGTTAPLQGTTAPLQGVTAPLQGVETVTVSVDGQFVQLLHVPQEDQQDSRCVEHNGANK